MIYPTNLLRAFAVVCSWRIPKAKISTFFESTKLWVICICSISKRTIIVSLLMTNLLCFLKFGIPHDLAHDYFSSFCSPFARFRLQSYVRILNQSIICPKLKPISLYICSKNSALWKQNNVLR